MKHRSIIAGIPVQVSINQIYDMGGSVVSRAKTYFGKRYGNGIYNMDTATYIDNYVSLLKFISDEEELRNTAWEITLNTMEPEDKTRPDKLVSEEGVKSDSVMKDRMIKLLDKFQNGWCTIRYLMNVESHEKFVLKDFFDDVIIKYDIDHEVKKTFKGNVLIDVNIIDFCDKYFCQKYSISLEDLDI